MKCLRNYFIKLHFIQVRSGEVADQLREEYLVMIEELHEDFSNLTSYVDKISTDIRGTINNLNKQLDLLEVTVSSDLYQLASEISDVNSPHVQECFGIARSTIMRLLSELGKFCLLIIAATIHSCWSAHRTSWPKLSFI